MADAVRTIVRNGDKTTAGGTVIAPGSNYTVMGKQIANVHCQVNCPACNSAGSIQSVPPMPNFFDYDGVRAAFDGDLCICGCNPHPRLIASLPTSQFFASNYGAPIVSTPAAADWLLFAGHDPGEHGIATSQSFLLVDESTGDPLANVSYQLECDGQTVKGVTDSKGMTKTIYSVKEKSKVTVYLETPA